MKLFATYSENLRQLRVVVESKSSSTDLHVELGDDSRIVINGHEFVISPRLRFDSSTLRLLSKGQFNEHVSFSFVVEAEPEEKLESSNNSNQTKLPPNGEILNDWLFCHNHGDHRQDEAKATIVVENRCLGTESEVIAFLCQHFAGTTVLLESSDKLHHVLVKLINLRTFHCCLSTSDDPMISTEMEVHKLTESISLSYKILRAQDIADKAAILEARRSFETEWTRVDSEVLKAFSDSLRRSTNNHIPEEEKSDENGFYRAYVVFSQVKPELSSKIDDSQNTSNQ